MTLRGILGTAAPRGRRAQGFTLLELVISMVLLGLLALTASFFWVDGFNLVTRVNADTNGMADARLVLERLARELREVKYNTSTGAYCISTMTATQLVFNKTSGTYVNTCGGASPTGTDDDYAVSIQWPSGTSNLNLGYAGTLASPATTNALSSSVSSFGIRYLDVTYAVTASTSAVRFIELSLTLAPTDAQATQSRTVVALRND
jgi:prepilin-type N-terminal cleavage/methylation domain-containing protein